MSLNLDEVVCQLQKEALEDLNSLYEKDNLKYLIEFDGIQHFEEQSYFTHNLTSTKNNDIINNNIFMRGSPQ